MPFRPRRSALYMPGSNARALEKARSLACDVVILDLEDAVAPDAKEAARRQVAAAVKVGGYGRRELVIRINGMASPWFEADLSAAADAAPDAILVPKVDTPRDLEQVGARLLRLDAPERVRVWAMIETPLGVLNVASIADTATRAPESRLDCLVLGTNDIAKETRAAQTASRLPMLLALSSTVLAARAHRLDVLDGVYNAFKDLDGLRRECQQGVELGMDGKTLIHPDQIAVANEAFAPSAAEIDAARRIITAFDAPEAKGKGAITIDGRMVELLHAEMARRTVAIADAIADRKA
jgi:citrate lyase subunit beta/citryl-CoA lyase